jgi:hypothetical protein
MHSDKRGRGLPAIYLCGMNPMAAFFHRNRWLLVLIVLAVSIRWFSLDPHRVDRMYAEGVYPLLSALLRLCVGWVPFSIGDWLYLLAGVGLSASLVRWFRMRRGERGIRLATGLRRAAGWMLGLYIAFNLLWGLNYDRSGLEQRLELRTMASDTALLPELTSALLSKVNAYAPAGQRGHVDIPRLLGRSLEGYREAGRTHPALGAPGPSFKPSLFGDIGSYIGYSGYYNPFTGEGQLNTGIPTVLHPFVTCHELAHQVGFARENEANLAGFLAARATGDSSFRYSAYLDMFLYANRNLYFLDSAAARLRYEELSPLVRRDIRELQAFHDRYRTVIDRATDWLFDRFLRLNGQKDGIRSYGSVVVWLLAIYRQEGGI